jgi:hypothetical protein
MANDCDVGLGEKNEQTHPEYAVSGGELKVSR